MMNMKKKMLLMLLFQNLFQKLIKTAKSSKYFLFFSFLCFLFIFLKKKSKQKQFTESNYHQLFQFIIQFVSTEFEKHILKLKFNQFGALLFDKHFRNLSNYFTNVTQWTTRDKFARLNQISTLLNFEKVNEIYDYWGNQSSLSWRLTSTEVKQILALRIEFKSDDINRLKL